MKCFASVCAFAMVISQICLLASMMLAIVLYKEILFRWQVSMCIISAYKQFISLVKYSPKGHVPLVSYPIYGQFVLKPPTRIQHFLLIPSSENFHYSTPPPPSLPPGRHNLGQTLVLLMLIAQFSFHKLGSVYSVVQSSREFFTCCIRIPIWAKIPTYTSIVLKSYLSTNLDQHRFLISCQRRGYIHIYLLTLSYTF